MTLSLSKLMAVADKATDEKWYVVGQPWLPRGCETYVISGSPDPHAGTVVCDMTTAEMAGAEDRYSDDEWSTRNDLNAAHIATFDPPTVKRLLAIAKAALEYRDSYENLDKNANVDAFTNLIESMEGVEP